MHMDRNDREQRPPKDFLALSHGQEWVAFYESFDKLVQDNLSRSSELLRRAMSLPEVADREVQQIRTEMEDKLAAEKDRQKNLLGALREDITGSHRQVSALARAVGSVMSDLERLNQRVLDALAAYDHEQRDAASNGTHAPVANGTVNGSANGSYGTGPLMQAQAQAQPAGTGMLSAPRTGTGSLASAPVAEAPMAQASESVAMPAEPVEELEDVVPFELPDADAFAGEFDISDIAAAVEEQQAMLNAAEQQLDNLEDSIDLSAMAEAETVPAEPVAAAAPAEPRPRPHWLSVTRVGQQP
jgi:hypothetical protein